MDISKPSRSFLIRTFIGSNIVTLGSGTPYIYSYYAPQLLSRCNIPIKYSSNIALSLNIGSSLLGMLAGVLVDINPRLATLVGSIATFIAYGTLYLCYKNAISSTLLLSFALALVGFGAISGLYAGMKVCTANFPNHRGTAGACPVSLYGLSGLLFSTICRNVFKGDIEAVFLFLLIICSSMSFVGVFTLDIFDFKKTKEWEYSGSVESLEEPVALKSDPETITFNSDNHMSNDHSHSRTVSLSRFSPGLNRYSGDANRSPGGSPEYLTSDTLDNRSPLITQSATMDNMDGLLESIESNKNETSTEEKEVNEQTLLECVLSTKFILYFIIIGILQGIGQTYIYSVGFIVQAQVNSMDQSDELIDTATIQATQVAIVSLCSFFGRLSSGLFSDFLVKKLNSQRIWAIFCGASFMIIGSANIISVDPSHPTLRNVYTSSIIFGYAFGAVFGAFPSIVADSFGTKNFSKVWGICTTGCMFTIKIFTAVLAHNLARYTEPGESTCQVGVKCYGDTFHVIEMSAFLGCILILFIIGTTYKKTKRN
ncbi:hypothetical protein MOUN0_L07558 [Monosporozyma unispora]|nr:hypothetical protein C6P44_004856 [Kazachstania unispora]